MEVFLFEKIYIYIYIGNTLNIYFGEVFSFFKLYSFKSRLLILPMNLNEIEENR